MTRPIDLTKRDRILSALTAEPAEFYNIGTPPYNVSFLAERLNLDPANLRKYLLRLECDGLAVADRRKVEVWNAIAAKHQPKNCLCYWNAATMDADREAADAWKAGAEARSDAALKSMYG